MEKSKTFYSVKHFNQFQILLNIALSSYFLVSKETANYTREFSVRCAALLVKADAKQKNIYRDISGNSFGW
jgi:hypothetical protein